MPGLQISNFHSDRSLLPGQSSLQKDFRPDRAKSNIYRQLRLNLSPSLSHRLRALTLNTIPNCHNLGPIIGLDSIIRE